MPAARVSPSETAWIQTQGPGASAPGWAAETFTDPFGGGYSYAALRPDPAPPEAQLAMAPAMIIEAKGLAAKWQQARSTGQPVDGLTAAQWEAKVRESIRSLEVMRGLYGVFGRTW